MVSPGQFKVVTQDEWERWPSRYASHASPWLPAVDALERGEVIEVHWSDPTELKSITMTIARRAGQRGFRVETRNTENHTRLFKRAPEVSALPSPTPNGSTKAERKRSAV